MAKKRKKSVLILSILLVLLVALCALYIGGSLYLKHRAAGWKRDGIAASIAGDDAKASELLLRYLRRHPSDTEALTYYVSSRERAPMANGQQFAETIAALKLLIQQLPDNLDHRLHLLELYVKLERGPEAIDTANQLLAKAPKNVRGLQLKTQLQTDMGQPREALETANTWTSVAPDELPPHLARLSLESRLEHPAAEIIAEATRLRESHPGNADFELLQGAAFARAGDDDQAKRWLESAASHPDLSPETAKILVEQLDSAGLSTDALSVLSDLVKRSRNPDLRQALAQRLWELQRWRETADALAPIAASDPQADSNLLAFKCMSLTHLLRNDEAKTIRKVMTARIDPASQAWTLLLQRTLDGTMVDDQKIARACQTAISSDPQNSYLTYYMGEADLRRGELDLAIDAFRRAAALNTSWNLPAVQLVECLLQKGKPMQAVEVAKYCAHQHPNNAASVITLARAWAAGVESGGVGQSDGLLKLVSDLQKQLPGEDRTLLIQIQLLAEQKQTDQAISVARAAIKRTPPPSEDVFRFITAASKKYSLGLEADCYSQWEHAYGITPALADAKATDQFAAGHGDAGLRLFDELAQKSGKAGEMDWKLVRAGYLDRIGSPDAKPAWGALRDAYPNVVTVQDAAASARAVQGDWQFMQPVIDNLHRLSGDDGLTWRLAQASLMIESPRSEDDYEKGSLELNKLIQRHPELSEPHVLLARALVHMRRMDGAIEHLTTASQRDPTSVPIALQLSALLQSQGDFERVEQELDRITPYVHTREQRQQAATLLSQQNDPDRAIKLLQSTPSTAAAGSSDETSDSDPRQDLLLAMLYRQRHETARADALIRKLMAHPDLQTIQFASSLFLSEGLRGDAESALHHLDQLTLEPGMKDLAWGWFYSRVGELNNAIDSYSRAVQAAPRNETAWKQLAISQMADHQSQAAMQTVEHAGAALPDSKDFSAIKTHSDMLIEAGNDPALASVVIDVLKNPLNSDALVELLQAALEERHSRDREHFAAALQNLCERHPECLPGQIQLVQCYLDMGRLDEAVTTAQHLMSAFTKDPQPAQVAVQVCRSAGRWREMESAAQSWKDRSPESAEAADDAMAQADIQQQHFNVALDRLQSYRANALSDPDRHIDTLSLLAIALGGTGDANAAGNVLWPLTSRSDMWRHQWVSVALDLPDDAAAVDWLERVSQIIPAGALSERIALAEAYDRLGRRLNDQKMIARASELCNQAGNDPAASAAVLLAAAAQAERTGRPGEAELFYRHALKCDPTIWVAQNNLAMLVLDRGGDLSEAERLAQGAVDLVPQDPQPLDTLAEVRAKAGKTRAAADCMRTAVKLEPDNALWRIRLAQYLLADGDRAGASQAVADIDSDMPDLHHQPAEVQREFDQLHKQIAGTGKG